MRFLINVIDDTNGSATGDEMAAIDSFNDGLRENGHWVFAGGICDPAESIVIDNRTGAGVVSDGPLIAAHEHIAGMWIIEAATPDAARGLALQGSLACNRKVELRQFH